jgi:hypothetical protein
MTTAKFTLSPAQVAKIELAQTLADQFAKALVALQHDAGTARLFEDGYLHMVEATATEADETMELVLSLDEIERVPAPAADSPLVASLKSALDGSPASGLTAPDLVGVNICGVFVCATCVGRIIARGMGHLFREGNQVWRDGFTRVIPMPPCATCGK